MQRFPSLQQNAQKTPTPRVADDLLPPEGGLAPRPTVRQVAAGPLRPTVPHLWDTRVVNPPASSAPSVPDEPAPVVPAKPVVAKQVSVEGSRLHQDAVLFLRGVLGEGIRRGASDVHFEPRAEGYHIRYRIDGVLREYVTRPSEEYPAVLNTIKVLADVDIAEKSIPQDGHIEFALEEVAGNEIQNVSPMESVHVFDVRVSTFPSVNGEVVVMRLLNRSDALLSLEDIGMDISSLEQVREMLVSSFGMILITGPTGSGKTTTLYSIMQELQSSEKNMITLEDPIEFHLDWLRQCEIKESRGFTFERAMASVLRQDPDVLMVGEIRDAKTAEYAVRSALVGNLVGSTIHANTATGTIARLLDLGIPRSILAHALNGVIAQRLVRRNCGHCKEEYTPASFYLSHFGLEQSTGLFYRGKGCDHCGGSGFIGRMGVYSVMRITDALRSMIFEQRSLVDIQQQAIAEGMRTLKMDAATKVLKGMTTAEEAARVI